MNKDSFINTLLGEKETFNVSINMLLLFEIISKNPFAYYLQELVPSFCELSKRKIKLFSPNYFNNLSNV
jgi:hypothetical protein